MRWDNYALSFQLKREWMVALKIYLQISEFAIILNDSVV